MTATDHQATLAPPATFAGRTPAGMLLRGPRSHGRYATILRFGVWPLLVALDLGCAAVAVLAAGWEPHRLLLLPLVVLLLSTGRLYRSRLTVSALDDLPSLSSRGLAAGALLVAGEIVVGHGSDHSGGRTMLAAGVLAGLLPVGRALGYVVVRGSRRRRLVKHPTLILGAGRVGHQVAKQLLAHPEYGLAPVGFLDSDPLELGEERTCPVLGGDEALSQTIVEFGVRDVVVAFGSMPESSLVEVIRTCDRLDVEIFFVPRLFELHESSREMDLMWGLPLVRLRRAAFQSWTWVLKRALDASVAAVALVLASPVMLALAVAVRLEGGPGIFFRQDRVGLDGRPFSVLKFRSLKPVDDSESATMWNIRHDDRLGRVGRFMRQTSLDELPQLWNILRGDMSLVGPRPERPYFVETFAELYPRYTARHRVPAGLTGWAQVHGLRGDTSIEERARFDNYYIENWSVWLDIKILLMTVPAVLRRRGAG